MIQGVLPALVAAPCAPVQSGATATAAAAAVEVVCDVDEPRVRAEVLAVAAAAWKEACALYGVAADPGERPVELHVHREVAAYEAACDKLVGGHFKRNLAFAEWTTLSAHVVLQPPVREAAFATFAPTWQTLRLVAHETAHLARYVKLRNHRSHPGWFADGDASWIETRVLATRGQNTPEESPFFATEGVRAQRLAKLDRLPSVDDLLHDRTDALEFYDCYAVRWLLFRFLVEGAHARSFREFLGDLRRLGGGDDFRDRAASALQRRIGAADGSAIDGEFRAWVAALKPEWEQIGGSLETEGEEWSQISFSTNAIAFQTAPAGARPYALEGTVTTFVDRAKPQMNVLLGRLQLSDDSNRFVSIALVPGSGVTVFDFDAGRDEAVQWTKIGFAALPDTAVGKSIAFRVECEPKDGQTGITIRIGGQVALNVTIDRMLDGPWGLGAQAGSSGNWRGVRLVAASR